MKVFLLSVFVVAVMAQGDESCDSPAQWEGREFHIHHGEGGFTSIEKISYDETNMRYRRIEEIEFFNHSRSYYDELFLHNEDPPMGYSLNLRTRECVRFFLHEPFRVIGVPEGARYYGEHYLGSSAAPGAGLEVKDFSADTPRGRFHGTFTVEGCIPVSHSYYSDNYGDRVSRFFDITLGIGDPNVFIPPRECMEP